MQKVKGKNVCGIRVPLIKRGNIYILAGGFLPVLLSEAQQVRAASAIPQSIRILAGLSALEAKEARRSSDWVWSDSAAGHLSAAFYVPPQGQVCEALCAALVGVIFGKFSLPQCCDML